MNDFVTPFIITLFIVAIFILGALFGSDMQKRTSEINVLNGTAQYRLEKQDDSTVDWIKVTPYAVNCEPAREFRETD